MDLNRVMQLMHSTKTIYKFHNLGNTTTDGGKKLIVHFPSPADFIVVYCFEKTAAIVKKYF